MSVFGCVSLNGNGNGTSSKHLSIKEGDQKIVAEFPVMEVGDTWETIDHSAKFGTDTYTYKVTDVRPDGSFDIQVTPKKEEKSWFVHYDRKSPLLRGITLNSFTNILSFPLFVGKEWKDETNSKSTSGEYHNYSFSYLVEKYETISTTGGNFEAFKIVRKGKNLDTKWSGTEYFWYSPGANAVVKSKSPHKRGQELIRCKRSNGNGS